MKRGFFMEFNDYEVNADTLILIPMEGNNTKVVEVDNTFIVKCSTLSIIKKSC